MLRSCVAFILIFAVTAGALSFASGQSTETPLGQCVIGGDTVDVSVQDGAEGKRVLAMSAGSASTRQSFTLQTPCLEKLDTSLGALVKIGAVDALDPENIVAGFGIAGMDGDAKWVSVWLNKNGGRWTMRGEWAVDNFNHKELGEKKETQTFTFEANGILKRSASRNNMDGIKTTCAQGCCTVWQSKTMVTDEVETLVWNSATRLAERQTFQKWYVAQPGEGVMSIAVKIYGSPERMTTLLRLNPGIQKQEKLNDDQKIVVENYTK